MSWYDRPAGTLTDADRYALQGKAASTRGRNGEQLAALQARIDRDPTLLDRLPVGVRVQLGYYAEALAAQKTLREHGIPDEDGPTAA